jgi:glycosyltransferase involved in cell wall biosynthesis
MASGEAANTLFLARGLARRYRVHVVTGQRDDLLESEGVMVHGVMPGWSWRHLPRLWRTLRGLRPDAVFIMYLGAIYEGEGMITFLPTLLRRWMPRPVLIVRFENPRPGGARITAPYRFVRQLLLGRRTFQPQDYDLGTLMRDSDAAIVLCDGHRKILLPPSGEPTVPLHVVPPACNIEVVADVDGARRASGRRQLDAGAEIFVLGFLGYVYRGKGMETLLDALARIIATGQRVRLVVLGGSVGVTLGEPDYYDAIRRSATERGLDGVVHWAGAFTRVDDRTAALLHACDAYVLPFDHGLQMNNSSFAALASYGRPIVSTLGPETDAILRDGSCVALCPPADPAALAATLQAVRDDSRLRERLTTELAAFVARYLTWSGVADATAGIIESAAAHRDARPG